MPDIWKKLNLKSPPRVVIVDAPESFEPQIAELDSHDVVRGCGKTRQIDFLLAFVIKRSAIKRLAAQVAKKAVGDAVIWFANPKKTPTQAARC